jgi:hypothetical protein
MPTTRPTDPETESTTQGGWVRSKRDIPADEEAVEVVSWPGEDDEDEPTKETESGPRVTIPPKKTQ